MTFSKLETGQKFTDSLGQNFMKIDKIKSIKILIPSTDDFTMVNCVNLDTGELSYTDYSECVEVLEQYVG